MMLPIGRAAHRVRAVDFFGAYQVDNLANPNQFHVAEGISMVPG
ncbi:MAG: hypothetical protein ACYSPI_04495 [Planctomycetota bacterium]